jgi:hypothetical protein
VICLVASIISIKNPANIIFTVFGIIFIVIIHIIRSTNN